METHRLFRQLRINYWCANCPDGNKRPALLRHYCAECKKALCRFCDLDHEHATTDMRKQYVPMNRIGPPRKVSYARPKKPRSSSQDRNFVGSGIVDRDKNRIVPGSGEL